MDQIIQAQKNEILAEHTASNDKAVEVMNRVIAQLINSREEFLTFAGKADSTALFDLCMSVKTRRDDIALSLQHQVVAIGGEPATDENFVGWVHHAWLKTRLAFETENDYVIAAEAMREEESMRLALTDAIETNLLPAPTQVHLEVERDYCVQLHQMFEELKTQLKPDDYVDLSK